MSGRTLPRLAQKLHRGFFTSSKRASESDQKPTEKGTEGATGETNASSKTEVDLPPEPTYCCMSGCANCVWIKYAQELTQLLDNGDVIARQKILEKVQDPNHRAFLFTHLGLKET